LLKKAEEADSTPLEDGLSVSGEIARREERKAKLKAARAEMEARAAVRAVAERADYDKRRVKMAGELGRYSQPSSVSTIIVV
jgi:hypothetical protein